jgi:hypothetical protein
LVYQNAKKSPHIDNSHKSFNPLKEQNHTKINQTGTKQKNLSQTKTYAQQNLEISVTQQSDELS